MPFGVRRQDCTNSEGKPGKYVVYRRDTGQKVSCHGSRSAAQAAARIRTEASGGKRVSSRDLLIMECDRCKMRKKK
jgi:hypothetical protein